MDRYAAQRQQVVDICGILSEKGYLAGTGGNVALRLDDDHFAVTPSATDYAAMAAADIAVLRLDTLEQIDGAKPASVERGLHAKLLRARPSRPASVHTHQPIASAVAILREPLPWHPGADRAQLGDRIALVPYRPSGTGMLAKALAKSMRPDVHAYLLASHGVICAAQSLAAAAAMIAQIEAAAAHYLKTRIARQPGTDSYLDKLVSRCLDRVQQEEGQR